MMPSKRENRKVRRGRPPRPEREQHRRRERPCGRHRYREKRAAPGAEALPPRAERHDAENPIGAQVQRQGEDHARAHHPESHQHDRGGEQRDGKLSQGPPASGPESSGGRIQKQDREGQTHAQVEGENHAVLAAAQQASNAELHDGGFE